MTFDRDLLETYRSLLRDTELQRAYQEFVRFFRWLRGSLEQQLPEFRFQSGIAENAMDYAYFSFTSPELREKGLKLVVAFVHKEFQLEVWLSGVNRQAQCRWADRLPGCEAPMEKTADPAHLDYLVRLPVTADPADGDTALAAVRQGMEKLLQLVCGQ